MSENMIASWVMAVLWASEIDGSGVAGDGFRRACIRARDARTASSMEDRYGILTLVGNHCKVSVMRVDLVSLMYTV